MEYRKYEKCIIARLDQGDEVLESIKNIAVLENIKLAKVSAIGATNEFTIGAYNVEEKKYYKKDYKGIYEIVSLIGNITMMDDTVYLHIHMGVADEKGNFIGGHLNKAIISATCEIFINIINGDVGRVLNDKIGLNVFKF